MPLSRTGNSGHTVARVQTTLQNCNRVHTLLVNASLASKHVSDEQIARQACIGLGTEFFGTALQLIPFVKLWSGGKEAFVFQGLESYERTITMKRKIFANDLGMMAKIKGMELVAPRYIPAMIKALLGAPSHAVDANGYATIFNSSDYSSLAESGRNRPFAIEANALMESAHSFLAAYAQMSATAKLKLTSDLEVAAVLHVHQKKYDTRQSFKAMLHIERAHAHRSKKRWMLNCQYGRSSRL